VQLTLNTRVTAPQCLKQHVRLSVRHWQELLKQWLKKDSMAKKEMIKRADGTTSQRGLWDNIRANKGSGKKPTTQMLKQEKKIKAKK